MTVVGNVVSAKVVVHWDGGYVSASPVFYCLVEFIYCGGGQKKKTKNLKKVVIEHHPKCRQKVKTFSQELSGKPWNLNGTEKKENYPCAIHACACNWNKQQTTASMNSKN